MWIVENIEAWIPKYAPFASSFYYLFSSLERMSIQKKKKSVRKNFLNENLTNSFIPYVNMDSNPAKFLLQQWIYLLRKK